MTAKGRETLLPHGAVVPETSITNRTATATLYSTTTAVTAVGEIKYTSIQK